MPVLFSIETDAVRLTWSQARPPTPRLRPGSGAPFGLVVTPVAEGIRPEVQVHARQAARLLEQTGYTVFVQSRTDAAVYVRHRDPVLLAGLHRADEGRVVHGTLNFGSQVGHSRFILEVGGKPHLAFTVEVFPSKLDYQEDYTALRDDVQEIAAGLAQAYLRPAVQPAGMAPGEPPGTAGWVRLLHHVMEGLEQALAYLARYPRWSTRRAAASVRSERVRRPDPALVRSVQHRAGQGAWAAGTLPVRARLPASRSHYTLDTPEHRWLVTQLRQIHARLALVHAEEAAGRTNARRLRVLSELEHLQERVGRLLRLEPLQGASEAPPPNPSLPLLTAPGYREAYRALTLLRQGLHLGGSPLEASVKDLHVLYEYWCVLALVRAAAAILGRPLPAAQLLSVTQRGLHLHLRQGRAQRIRIAGSGCRILLYYNPRFGGRAYLVPQQPDLLMAVQRRGGATSRYVLDAKYRLDASPSYRQRYGTPGPPVDALNDLHRYRDALRTGDAGIEQAVALFPYREEQPGAFAASRHGRALEAGGVAALPLLPSATGYLDAWLGTVLDIRK